MFRKKVVPVSASASAARKKGVASVALYNKVMNWDITAIKNRWEEKYYRAAYKRQPTDEYTDLVAREMLRWLYLLGTNKKLELNIGTARDFDEMWHIFIIFTTQYTNFCEKNFGKYVHHHPSTGVTRFTAPNFRKFLELYETNFGQEAPEQIWPRDILKPKSPKRNKSPKAVSQKLKRSSSRSLSRRRARSPTPRSRSPTPVSDFEGYGDCDGGGCG